MQLIFIYFVNKGRDEKPVFLFQNVAKYPLPSQSYALNIINELGGFLCFCDHTNPTPPVF